MTIYEPESGLPADTKSAATMTSDIASRTARNIFVVINHSVYAIYIYIYTPLQQPEGTDTPGSPLHSALHLMVCPC